MKKKKYIFLILLLLFLLLIIVFGFNNKKLRKVAEKGNKEFYSIESRIDDIKKIQEKEKNVTEWINVQGTNIDLPVLKKQYSSLENYPWISYYYNTGENRKVIYGHNVLNVSSLPIINGDGHSGFEPLMSFVYEEHAKNNLYITYTYDGVDHIYKIYAVSFQYHYEEGGLGFDNEDYISNYIEWAKKESIYDYDVDVNTSDNLISLITCTRYFGLNGKTQFRVDAREIRKNENIDKYHVEKNENYDIIINNRRSSGNEEI